LSPSVIEVVFYPSVSQPPRRVPLPAWASLGEGKRGHLPLAPLADQNSMFFDFFWKKIVCFQAFLRQIICLLSLWKKSAYAHGYRDLETFLPGLELFWKLKNSLKSALKRYQLLNLIKKWLEMQPSWHFVVAKHDW